MSRIEQTISEIEEYLDSCKYQPLSNTKIVVNKEQLEELLSELRLRTPEEIKKYQRMLANREAILEQARKQAEDTMREAQRQKSEIISEHEIMQQAYIQANEVISGATEQAQAILDRATLDANNIRTEAIRYTDEKLLELQNLITYSVDNFQSRYDAFISSINKVLEIVISNREELNPSESVPGGDIYDDSEDDGDAGHGGH